MPASVKVHPLQLEYTTKSGTQTCNLCGTEEKWTAQHQPTTEGEALNRSLHLVHLVKDHLPEVQKTFTNAERAKEVVINAEG